MAKQTFSVGQVLTAAQMTSLQQTAMLGGAPSAKTANYTLVAADAGTAISMSSTSATTITVNTGLFAAGDTIQITNLNTGVCTITAGTATVNTSASLALAQYESGTLVFTSASAAIFIKGAGGAATSGMTLIATQSISAVSSISAANGTFSSTYDNYRVLLKITTFVGQDQTFRFRTSGTDNTTSNYRYSWLGIDTGGTNRSGYGTAETSALITRGNSAHAGIMSVTLDIFSPFKTEKTTATGQAWGSDGAPSSFAWSGGIAFNDTTSFDAFTLIFPGSTTGTMSIYGLAK